MLWQEIGLKVLEANKIYASSQRSRGAKSDIILGCNLAVSLSLTHRRGAAPGDSIDQRSAQFSRSPPNGEVGESRRVTYRKVNGEVECNKTMEVATTYLVYVMVAIGNATFMVYKGTIMDFMIVFRSSIKRLPDVARTSNGKASSCRTSKQHQPIR